MPAHSGGLKQFDWLAGRIFRKNLFSAHPIDDLVAKVSTLASQGLDQGVKVIYLNDEAVPAARLGDSTVQHWLSG